MLHNQCNAEDEPFSSTCKLAFLIRYCKKEAVLNILDNTNNGLSVSLQLLKKYMVFWFNYTHKVTLQYVYCRPTQTNLKLLLVLALYCRKVA